MIGDRRYTILYVCAVVVLKHSENVLMVVTNVKTCLFYFFFFFRMAHANRFSQIPMSKVFNFFMHVWSEIRLI